MSELRVYFEKQGGDRLCGVHCLNSLLQGPVFTQSDLNKFGADLDKEEALLLASSKPAVPRSMTISSLSNRPKSDNVDDTGNFSLGVLERALKTKFGLTVENAARREIVSELKNLGFVNHDGFVIHLNDHWFSARAVANPQYPGVREWFFLDSLKSGPQPVSENELWGTLQGLIQSGNQVFVLSGKLPPIPVSTRLSSNQFYLSRLDIKNRLAGIFEKTDSVVKTDWNSLGQGHSLSTSSGHTQPTAIPPPTATQPVQDEPEANAPNTVTLMVRLPDGTSRKTRRFSRDDHIVKIWEWVHCLVPAATVLVGRGIKLLASEPTNLPISTAFGSGEQVLFNIQ